MVLQISPIETTPIPSSAFFYAYGKAHMIRFGHKLEGHVVRGDGLMRVVATCCRK